MADICGTCEVSFSNREEYLAHKCSKTGFTPTDVKHLDATSGGRFSLQSLKALARGNEKAGVEIKPKKKTK